MISGTSTYRCWKWLHKNAVELRTKIPGIHHEPFAHVGELILALKVVRDGVLGDPRTYAFGGLPARRMGAFTCSGLEGAAFRDRFLGGR